MNLIQAVQSGRPFRQVGDEGWYPENKPWHLDADRVLATDWETKPESRAGELCRECFDPPQLDDFRYVQTCRDVGHTPFKWREVE